MKAEDKKELKSIALFLEASFPLLVCANYFIPKIGQKIDDQEIPELAKKKITLIKGEIVEIKENNTDLNSLYNAIPKDSLQKAFVYEGQEYVRYNKLDQITPLDRINEKQELITSLETNPANHFPAENAQTYGMTASIAAGALAAIGALTASKFRNNVANVTDKFNKGVVKVVTYPFKKKTAKPEME